MEAGLRDCGLHGWRSGAANIRADGQVRFHDGARGCFVLGQRRLGWIPSREGGSAEREELHAVGGTKEVSQYLRRDSVVHGRGVLFPGCLGFGLRIFVRLRWLWGQCWRLWRTANRCGTELLSRYDWLRHSTFKMQ